MAHWLTQAAIYSPSTQTWNPAASIPNGSGGQAADVNTTLLDQTFRLAPRLAPDLAVEVSNGSSANLDPIDVAAWNQADQQLWQFNDAGGGEFTLVQVNAARSALDDQFGGSADGNPSLRFRLFSSIHDLDYWRVLHPNCERSRDFRSLRAVLMGTVVRPADRGDHYQ